MKSFVRISALLWADILVTYALFVMQNYLTKVWNLSFTHAAGILNIWMGISLVLPVLFLFLVDAFLGNFAMLVISSIAYSVGIGFVTMSTPPVLAKSTGLCKQYKPECIGHTQKVLFYTGMALIAVGVAGNHVSVKPFLEEQKEEPHNNDNYLKVYLKLPVFTLVVIVPIVGAFALPYIKPWSLRFGIPAICTAIATLLFLSGSCTYNKIKPQGRLSSVEEVESAKINVLMVPMCATIIICGIVSSIGNTYFVEQANHMNRKIGTWKVPLQVLLLLSQWAKTFMSCLLKKSKTYNAPLRGIAVAMIFSILCCITAARVEIRRLKVIKSHGLLEKPEETIPMSVFWLLFQFFLLAGLDLFFEKSVTALYNDQFSECMKNYHGYFTKGVSGLGHMCGVLSVYVVGKISEKGGKKNWFQSTLNKSRLDRYYWVLAAVSSVNLLVFILVALCYRYRNPETPNVEGTGRRTTQTLPPEENDDCPCCYCIA